MKRFILSQPPARNRTKVAAAAAETVPVSPNAASSIIHHQLPLSVLISRTQSLLAQERAKSRQQRAPIDHELLFATKKCLERVGSEDRRIQLLISQLDEQLAVATSSRKLSTRGEESKEPASFSEHQAAESSADDENSSSSSSSSRSRGSSVIPVFVAQNSEEIHRAVHNGRMVQVASAAVWAEVIGTEDVPSWLEQQADEPASSLFRREAQQPYCLTLASAIMHIHNSLVAVSSGELVKKRNSSSETSAEEDSGRQEENAATVAVSNALSLSTVASLLARCFVAPVFSGSKTALLCVMKSAAMLASRLLSRAPVAAGKAAFSDSDEIPDAIRIAAAVYGTSVFEPAILAQAMKPGFVVKASMVAEGGRVEDDTHLVRLLAKSPDWVLRLIVEDGIVGGNCDDHHHHHYHYQQHQSYNKYFSERELIQMVSVFQLTVKRAALTALLLRPASDNLAGINAETLNAAFSPHCGEDENSSSSSSSSYVSSALERETISKLALDVGFQAVLRVAQQRPGWSGWYRYALSTVLDQKQQQQQHQKKKSDDSCSSCSSSSSNNDSASKSLFTHLSDVFAEADLSAVSKDYRPLAVLVKSAAASSTENSSSSTFPRALKWNEALALCSRSIQVAPEFKSAALVSGVETIFSAPRGKNSAEEDSASAASVPIIALQRLVRSFDPPSLLAPPLAAKILQIGAATASSGNSSASENYGKQNNQQWHSALQLHDTILAKSSAAVASDAYQATLTALVDCAAQHSQAAAQVSAFSGLVVKSKWARALHIFWRGRSSEPTALAAVPSMRHVTAAVAYAAMACRHWHRALTLLSQRENLLAPRTIDSLFNSGSTSGNAGGHGWPRVLVAKSGAPEEIIERILPDLTRRKQLVEERKTLQQMNSGKFRVASAAMSHQDGIRVFEKALSEKKRQPHISAAEKLLATAFPSHAQSFLNKKKTAAATAAAASGGDNGGDDGSSLLFGSLRSVYRPSATAFAAALNHQHNVAATRKRERILRANESVAASVADLNSRSGGEKQQQQTGDGGGGVPIDTVLSAAPPPPPPPPPPPLSSNNNNDWVDALELFQDAWISSERGTLPSSVYLGALGFCNENFSPPLEVTRAVVNATKHSPAFTVDPRLAAALIRTAASARLWPDVIECFFLLLDSSQSRVVPNRASIAVVLTACKEIDSRCDKVLAEVKMYLEASLEDAFTTLGEDVVSQVQWFRSASTTIVTMEIRCGDFGSLAHVSKDQPTMAGRSSSPAQQQPSKRSVVSSSSSTLLMMQKRGGTDGRLLQ